MEAQTSTPAPSAQLGPLGPPKPTGPTGPTGPSLNSAQTSAQSPSQVSSQVSTRVFSPVNPQPNPTTHYANGLPRSINGLKGSATNGSASPGPPSPATATGTPGATTPTPGERGAPSPIMATAAAAIAATATPARPSPSASAPAPVLAAPVLAPAPLKPIVMYTPTQPHQPAAPRQSSQRQSSGKISIVEPPGSHSARPRIHPQGSHSSQGFPSPRREHQPENSKFMDDLSRLTHAMQQSVPSAVRRVIRDNWEKCLLGSEFHHAFLLNAVIHHSSGVIIRRSIKDFGGKMVAESKREIAEHLSTADVNEIADAILEKADDQFLDKALEKRLKTIDARSLINALARAERLGYEDSDIVEDRRDEMPRFNPAPGSFNPSPSLQPLPSEPMPRAPPRGPPLVLQCPLCWRKFDSPQPYEYHVQKQVCTKEPPNKEGFAFSCKYCGAGFVTKVGREYHISNNVCGDHAIAGATPKAPANGGSPITLSSGNNSPTLPLAHRPPGQYQQVPSSTPVQRRVSVAATPKDHDPYAHLEPNILQQLTEELRQAELSYTDRFKQAEAIEDPAARQAKLEGLQNSFSTKQSIIRKKYGVRLRNRRTKAEIDNERQRMGWKHSSPGQPEGTPSLKRQRTDDKPPHLALQASKSNDEFKMNHVSVSDMKTGLGGSNATAAMADPTRVKPPTLPDSPMVPKSPTLSKSTTLPKSPTQPQSTASQQSTPAQNSLSSMQRKGYRVSSHFTQPQPSQTVTTDIPMESPKNKQGSSALSPMVLDDAESSDSDSDEDIPASLPPRKADEVPSRHLAP
ncbi:hypothetical protein GGR53DRAFT_462579 [Hypoxylon sp. FL1150]|nr:hypothetical protein GGR53DRAFT_462579 [Hypoxylon sp. FL1150]